MKAIAKLYFGRAKHPKDTIKLNGASSVPAALHGLSVLIGEKSQATRAEITITIPRRRSK